MTILISIALAIVLMIIVWGIRNRAADHSQFDTPVAALVKDYGEVSEQHAGVLKILKEFQKHQSRDVKVQRRQMEDIFDREIDAQVTEVDVDGIPGEWVLASGADPARRLLYLHGGAFRVGSPKSHRYLTAELSKLAGVAVLAIDYRMQPEFKTIDCHIDARKAYQWILDNGPYGPSKPVDFFIAGDSAGGNLTLATIAWARDNQLPAVNGAIALAPVTDLTMGSNSWKRNLATDPFLGPMLGPLTKIPKTLTNMMMRIPTGVPLNNPEVSPLLGPLNNLPATLIQVSIDEMLFDDAQRYANKAAAAGSEVTLQVWPKMVHVFQAFGPDLPESNDAMKLIAQFIESQSSHSRQADESVSKAS